MPKNSRAKRKPKPSRRRLKLKPSCGNHSSLARSTAPANTPGCRLNSSTSAINGGSAAATAQAERPRRSVSTGRNSPRNGKATINASAISKTPYAGTPASHDRRRELESQLPDGEQPHTTTTQLSRCRDKNNHRLSIPIGGSSCIELLLNT